MFGLSRDRRSAANADALPPLTFKVVEVISQPRVMCASDRSALFTTVKIGEVTFSKELSAEESTEAGVNLAISDVVIKKELTKSALKFELSELGVRRRSGRVSVLTRTGTRLLAEAFKEVRVPVGVDNATRLPGSAIPMVRVRNFGTRVTSVPLTFSLATEVNSGVGIGNRFGVSKYEVRSIVSSFTGGVIPRATSIRAGTSVCLSNAYSNGVNKNRVPTIGTVFVVPRSALERGSFTRSILLTIRTKL